MKRLFLSFAFLLVACFCFSSSLEAAYKLNPFIGKLDYYEPGFPGGTSSMDATYLKTDQTVSQNTVGLFYFKSLTTPIIRTSQDSTTAMKIVSGDGSSALVTFDTVNKQTIFGGDGTSTFAGGVNSTIALGTAPYQCTSTTLNTNLNADLLDGRHSTAFNDLFTSGDLTATSPIVLSQTRKVIGGAADISHATTAGNIHLPAAGAANQVLKNSGVAGTGSWGTVTENAGALAAVTTMSMNNQLTNTLADGTKPFVITSTTMNDNLNADLLDGHHSSDFVTQLGNGKFGVTFDGGGSALQTGIYGYCSIPYAMTITGWTLLSDQSGSMVLHVLKDTYANYPPDTADNITGSAPPNVVTAIKSQDTTLTGWTTTVASGDTIAFRIVSASTLTKAFLIVYGNRT